MPKKYFLLEVEYPEDGYEIGPEEINLTSKQYSLEDLLKDPAFRQELVNQGWADTTNLNSVKGDENFGPRVVMLSGGHSSYGSYVTGSVIDPKNTTYMPQYNYGQPQFFAIEIGGDLLAKVAPEQAAVYKKAEAQRQAALKAAAQAEEKRKAKAAEAKAKRAARKLEDAKKTLEKAGIPVGDVA